MRNIKAIIFDLDGTLINTAPDVRLAINKTLALYGLPSLSLTEVYPLMGKGASVMLERAFFKNGINLTSAEITKSVNQYLNFYQENPVVDTEIYHGVLEILEKLKKNKISLGICTNKPAIMTDLVLDRLHLTNFFDVVVAGENVQYPKPDGRHILDVLKNMRMLHSQAVMVGDSEIDKLAADDAGVSFIGVSYGYDPHQLKADIIINSFLDLPAALNKVSDKEKETL